MEVRKMEVIVKSCKRCPYMEHWWNARQLFRCTHYGREITAADQMWMEQNKQPFPQWCEKGIV